MYDDCTRDIEIIYVFKVGVVVAVFVNWKTNDRRVWKLLVVSVIKMVLFDGKPRGVPKQIFRIKKYIKLMSSREKFC